MRSKGVGVESVLWEMGVKVARDQHCLFVIMEFVLWPERERERETHVAVITNEHKTPVTTTTLIAYPN